MSDSTAMQAAEAAVKASQQEDRPVIFRSNSGDAIQVRIDKNAQFKDFNGTPFFTCIVPLHGAHLKMFVFGVTEKDRGKLIAAIVELKCNETNEGSDFPYLRSQVIRDEKANKKLVVGKDIPDECGPMLCRAVFINKGAKKKVSFEIGFAPV